MIRKSRRNIECKDLVELVTEYLEDTLDQQRRTIIETHLRQCEGCLAYLQQMRQTIQHLGYVPLDPAQNLPDQVRHDLLAAFRAQHPA